MNTCYCSTCGKANPFEVERPRFCKKCGNEINKAFASLAPKPTEPPRQSEPAYSDPYQHPSNQRRERRIYDARGNDITDRFKRPEPASRHPEYEQDEGDFVDYGQKDALARQLAASIRASDFGITIDEEADDKATKLGPILQQALANGQASGKKRKARK